MSLLDRGTETVIVYPEIEGVDSDGNPMRYPSPTGIEVSAVVQVSAASGTSARRAEQDNEGVETEENYRLRIVRGQNVFLGPRARVEWRGELWSVVGFPRRYNGSHRTAHMDYALRRA
ncbi:hypothetical protein LZ318_11925 [Saccharopolyspora indica]|uniref:hypothetical protein n=1 Tax=Saccharopolyspora indica TaxID=1229659 RepID=UPI0022EB3539|nr:hypothetical protein [Saccharopolyspora indica]MDA3643784.1 hypothetical protein [Saccharopolyspora indica]